MAPGIDEGEWREKTALSPEVDALPISPLRKVAIQTKLEMNPSFYKALTYDLTSEFLEEVADRKAKEGNTILEAYGIGMSGKSYGMNWLAKKVIDPEFCIDKVFFKLEDLLSHVHDFAKGSCLLWDEDTKDYGVGSQRKQSEYENLIQTLRKAGISLPSCAVVPRLNEGLAHYELEGLYVDRKKREVNFALYYPSATGRWFDYICMGYIRLGHPADVLGEDFVKEYELRKDKFIDEQMRHSSGDYITDIANAVRETSEYQFLKEQRGGKLVQKTDLLELVQLVAPNLKRNIEAQTVVAKILFDERVGR